MFGEQYLQDGDSVIQTIETNNKADILFFTNRFNAYKAKIFEQPDTKASALGDYLPNLLSMQEDEQVVFIAATVDYSGELLFFFQNGKAARVALSGYATKTNRKKLINAYSGASEMVHAAHIAGETDFLLVRDKDKAMLFNTSLLETKISKSSSGVAVYNLSKKNSKLARVIPRDEITIDEPEYYRVAKIPSTGHFIKPGDGVL